MLDSMETFWKQRRKPFYLIKHESQHVANKLSSQKIKKKLKSKIIPNPAMYSAISSSLAFNKTTWRCDMISRTGTVVSRTASLIDFSWTTATVVVLALTYNKAAILSSPWQITAPDGALDCSWDGRREAAVDDGCFAMETFWKLLLYVPWPVELFRTEDWFSTWPVEEVDLVIYNVKWILIVTNLSRSCVRRGRERIHFRWFNNTKIYRLHTN